MQTSQTIIRCFVCFCKADLILYVPYCESICDVCLLFICILLVSVIV